MGRTATVRTTGIGPGEEPGRQDHPPVLAGTWVTSFSSFVHDDPQDVSATPRIEAYEMHDGNKHQTSGYFFAATILVLKFDGQGGFKGRVKINRGGEPAPQEVIFGTYEFDATPEFEAIEGTLFAVYPGTEGKPDIHMTYYFVVRDWNEIEWLRTSSDFRDNISRGTLKRVTVHP